MPRQNGSAGTIQAVGVMFSIVEELERQDEYRLTDLADALSMPKSTVHKYLKTLEELGYVQADSGTYRLGLKFLKHGGIVRDRCRIYTYGRAKVEALGDRHDEMAILSIREGNRGVFLFRSNDRYNLKESIPLGKRFYLHQNAAGKAMLAKLEDDAIRELVDTTGLPDATDSTITDVDALLDRIRTIRSQSYALNEQERDTSVNAVSAAIRDEKTGQIGAISLSIPSDSPTVKHLEGEYAEAVQQAASELSLQLKYN